MSWLSPLALVPLQAKSMPWPISGHGLAPGKLTPETSRPPPCSSYSRKICGEKQLTWGPAAQSGLPVSESLGETATPFDAQCGSAAFTRLTRCTQDAVEPAAAAPGPATCGLY